MRFNLQYQNDWWSFSEELMLMEWPDFPGFTNHHVARNAFRHMWE